MALSKFIPGLSKLDILTEHGALLLKGANILHIPTNAGWAVSNSGSGGTVQEIAKNGVYTGGTAASRGMLRVGFSGISSNGIFFSGLTWDEKTYLIFNYGRLGTAALQIARLQLKEVNTEGALAAKGIGLKSVYSGIPNRCSYIGESYGTELGEVGLNTTDLDGYVDSIAIVHDPSVPKIEWYVNGVLRGTQSTAAKIPSGLAGATPYLVHSIINGADTSVDVWSMLFAPKLWQAR